MRVTVRRCRVGLWSSVLRPACPAWVERNSASFHHTVYLTSGTQREKRTLLHLQERGNFSRGASRGFTQLKIFPRTAPGDTKNTSHVERRELIERRR